MTTKEQIRACQAARRQETEALRRELAALEERAATGDARAQALEAELARVGEEFRKRLTETEAAIVAEHARAKELALEVEALQAEEEARLSGLQTAELRLAVGLFPTFFPPWFRSAVMLLALSVLSGCMCTPTWFRSCGPPQPQVPVTLTFDVGGGVIGSYVLRGGALAVSVPNLPEGRWLVEAKRTTPAGAGVVLGSMQITVPAGTSLTEIEIWPDAGRSLGLDAYPVLTRITLAPHLSGRLQGQPAAAQHLSQLVLGQLVPCRDIADRNHDGVLALRGLEAGLEAGLVVGPTAHAVDVHSSVLPPGLRDVDPHEAAGFAEGAPFLVIRANLNPGSLDVREEARERLQGLPVDLHLLSSGPAHLTEALLVRRGPFERHGSALLPGEEAIGVDDYPQLVTSRGAEGLSAVDLRARLWVARTDHGRRVRQGLPESGLLPPPAHSFQGFLRTEPPATVAPNAPLVRNGEGPVIGDHDALRKRQRSGWLLRRLRVGEIVCARPGEGSGGILRRRHAPGRGQPRVRRIGSQALLAFTGVGAGLPTPGPGAAPLRRDAEVRRELVRVLELPLDPLRRRKFLLTQKRQQFASNGRRSDSRILQPGRRALHHSDEGVALVQDVLHQPVPRVVAGRFRDPRIRGVALPLNRRLSGPEQHPALDLLRRSLGHAPSVVPSRRERGHEPVQDGQAAEALGLLYLRQGLGHGLIFTRRPCLGDLAERELDFVAVATCPVDFLAAGKLHHMRVDCVLELPDGAQAPLPIAVGVDGQRSTRDPGLDLRINLLPADPVERRIDGGPVFGLQGLLLPLPVVGGDRFMQNAIGMGIKIGRNQIRKIERAKDLIPVVIDRVPDELSLPDQAPRQLRLLRVPRNAPGKLAVQDAGHSSGLDAQRLTQGARKIALLRHGVPPPSPHCTKKRQGTQAWTG